MVDRLDVAIKYPCGRDPYAVMVSDPDGSYVMAAHYDAARAEIERLVADLEWMRTDRNKWQDSATERYNRAEKAEAERDSFQAMFRSCLKGNDALREKAQKANTERDQAVAAAYEAAADALQNVADNWDCGHNESRLCDCARDVEQWGFAADEVRRMTPADANAALEAYGREKVREGMQRAYDLSGQYHQITHIRAAILAEMEALK